MSGFSRNGETCPQLLDWVSEKRDWFSSSHGCGSSSEEKKLELTLGPPGENWSSLKNQPIKNNGGEGHGHDHESLLSLGHGTIKAQKISSSENHCAHLNSWPSSAKFLQFPSSAAVSQGLPGLGKESSQSCNITKMVDLKAKNNNAENKGFAPSAATETAVPTTSQKRTAPAPVVGWPPIRSFRKNLASTSTKSFPESQNATQEKATAHEKRTIDSSTNSSTTKGLFVKINMDGVPIGRKVDLNAYDSYEKLSSAVDKLFRGLLAAQSDSYANGIPSNLEEGKPITGLLGGSGKYTLVYEDNEGDRVLVGDVPWRMFVSTVKRLRVLKTSELTAVSFGSKQQKMHLDSPR